LFSTNFADCFKKNPDFVIQFNKSTMQQSGIIKVSYFLTYAAAASWLAFFNLFLKNHIGLSDGQIGIIIAIQQVNTLLILPVWGLIADRFGRKNIFNLTIFLAIFMIYGFMFQHTFLAVVIFTYIFTLIYNPINPLLDSIALDYIDQHKKPSYGVFRLWASVGWATSSVVTGNFIDASNSHLIFAISSSIMILNFILMKFFYKPVKGIKGLKSLRLAHIKDVFLSDKRLYVMLIIMLFYGVFSSPVHFFINIYYDEIGGGFHHVGYAYLFQALAEVPFFLYGNRLIRRFGARKLIVFTMMVTAFRLLAYGMTSNPWIAIVIGTSHGITIGLFILSFVAFVHQFIPAEFRATGQSFVYAFYFGGGLAMGNIFTGILADFVGMQKTMLIQSGFTFLLILITLVIFGFFKKAGLLLPRKK